MLLVMTDWDVQFPAIFPGTGSEEQTRALISDEYKHGFVVP